jgi:hypothetical protein
MAAWTHPICDTCWFAGPGYVSPGCGRKPARMRVIELERCCYCQQVTDSGIYVRADPASLGCDHE